MEGVQSATGGALETAKELTQEYLNAVSALNAASGKGVEGGRGGDPRDFEDDPYWSGRFFPSPERPVKQPKTRRGGGGGGGSKIPEGLREAERLFDSTRTKAEQYALEVERINKLHRLFPEIVTTDVVDRAMKALNDSTDQLAQTAQTLEQNLASMFASVVTGATSAKETVSQLLGQMAQLFAQQAFSGLFKGLFPSPTPVPKFAAGTSFAPGGAAIVGERGPELVNLPRGAQVFNAARTQMMTSQAGGGGVGG